MSETTETADAAEAWRLWNEFTIALGRVDRIDPDTAKRIMNDVSFFETDWWGSHG